MRRLRARWARLLRACLALVPLLLLSACAGLQPTPAPTLRPAEARGRVEFEAHCSRCHAASGDGVVVGPSLAGIATRGAERIEGLDAEEYIRDSIRDPRRYIVEGFPDNLMPLELAEQIEESELDDLVLYLLSLE